MAVSVKGENPMVTWYSRYSGDGALAADSRSTRMRARSRRQAAPKSEHLGPSRAPAADFVDGTGSVYRGTDRAEMSKMGEAA